MQSKNFDQKFDLAIIMPAKNVDKYIESAVRSCFSFPERNTALVVIDDHSSDKTYLKLTALSKKYKNLLLLKNPGGGKVQAINYGFQSVSAEYYKFVDSDDILKKNFWNFFYSQEKPKSSFTHSLTLVSENLVFIRDWHMEDLRLDKYKIYIEQIKLLPKAAWTFHEDDASKIFPIPSKIPYEDIWFSFSVYCNNITVQNIKVSMYEYRQHNNQTFGQIADNSSERIRFRFTRIADALEIFIKRSEFIELRNEIYKAALIPNFMLDRISFISFVSKSNYKIALKFISLKHFRSLYETLQKLIWSKR